MSKRRAQVCLLFTSVVLSSLSYAAQPDRIQGTLFSGRSVPLTGHVHHRALPQLDQGPVDPAMQMGTMTLLTVPTAAQQKALTQLLAEQQDRNSPNYHKWLTPEQWADRFGLTRNDIRQITTWLEAQGFTNVRAARGRNWVSFEGTAAQVASALGTEIHHFNVNGEMHYANVRAPSVPEGVAGIVTGFRGLHDFLPRAMGIRKNIGARPYYNSSSFGQLVAPGDLGTIYDINALYSSGIDGTGQKLAVMGQTDIYLADLNDFRSGFGLTTISTTNCKTDVNGLVSSANPCDDSFFKYVLGGTEPGVKLTTGDLMEADLDLEWAGAVARKAKIIYVNSTDTFTSYFYAVDNNIAPVISLSYGLCEFGDNNVLIPSTGQPGPEEVELQKANAEGITFVNSSGDTGAAECDYSATLTSTNLATQGLAVSYPASSPEVTSVGGSATPLADFTSTYWGTSNGTDGGTALSYVPEQAWNDDYEFMQYCQANSGSTFCKQGGSTKQPGWVPITSEATAQQDIGPSSTGGGPSNCAKQNSNFSACVSGFPKPSWQTVTVSGQGNVRFSPDVSFFASPNFPGYIFCTPLDQLGQTGTTSSCANGITTAVDTYVSIIGGTSASTPVFAGMVVLLNQQTGGPNGNVNPLLYQLAAVAPNAFHDITTGDNKVYCSPNTPGAPQPSSLWCPSTGVLGFSAGTGYDLVTGLGSVDVNNLLTAAATPPDFTASSTTTSLKLFPGQSGTATITVTPVNNFTGSVRFSCSGLSGTNCSFSPGTVTLNGAAATTTATIVAGSTTGTLNVTATTGVLSQLTHPAASIALTSAIAHFSLSSPLAGGTVSVAQGQITQAVNMTVGSTDGFVVTSGTSSQTVVPVTYSCTGLPSESTCNFNPASPTSATTVSLTISTTAPTARLQRPLDRGTRILYAALLPGVFGIMFTLASPKRSWIVLRIIGLVAVLVCSTLWLASCGSGSSTVKNQGTPLGTYPITVNASGVGTSITAAPVLTFNLTVTQ
ncbi:MAG TPA: S53 family peptidase [Candidatus Sulfotelmatobacter sp.]|nr:S53 family peptidase [Candidatus Sulfotelmatobacter sp.]